MIRKSTAFDKNIIMQLLSLCFGDRDDWEACEDLEDRYYLYFEGDALVAMTGLTMRSEFRALEVDWTCTHPEYRGRGFMQELFSEMLKDVCTDVYCSCWRMPNRDKPNLSVLMELFGFKEVINTRVHWKVPHNCFRVHEGGCVNYTGAGCECYEDLYLRKV